MPTPGKKAFTLIEILVVIAIIGILVALLFPALQAGRAASDRASEISNLRQIAIAIQSYAGDNDQYLPGPLDPGQSPLYSNSLSNTLGYRLWKYIGANQPTASTQYAAVLDYPAHKRYAGNSAASATYASPSYVMNEQVAVGTGATANPWGSSTSTPVKTINVSSWTPGTTGTWTGPSNLWAMEDIDQQNVSVVAGNNANGITALPAKPLNGAIRIKLFFDWHVETTSTSIVP